MLEKQDHAPLDSRLPQKHSKKFEILLSKNALRTLTTRGPPYSRVKSQLPAFIRSSGEPESHSLRSEADSQFCEQKALRFTASTVITATTPEEARKLQWRLRALTLSPVRNTRPPRVLLAEGDLRIWRYTSPRYQLPDLLENLARDSCSVATQTDTTDDCQRDQATQTALGTTTTSGTQTNRSSQAGRPKRKKAKQRRPSKERLSRVKRHRIEGPAATPPKSVTDCNNNEEPAYRVTVTKPPLRWRPKA